MILESIEGAEADQEVTVVEIENRALGSIGIFGQVLANMVHDAAPGFSDRKAHSY